MSELTKEMKRVTFSPDTIENQPKNVIFSNATTKKAKLSGTKILSMLKHNQLNILESYLRNSDLTAIKNMFCSEQGQLIMSYLFSGATKEKFYFLLKNTPTDCLKNAICQNNYAFLVEFLKEEETTERYQADSEKIRKFRVERFKWFLETDKEIETFISSALQTKKEYITEKIMDDFKLAMNSLKCCLKIMV